MLSAREPPSERICTIVAATYTFIFLNAFNKQWTTDISLRETCDTQKIGYRELLLPVASTTKRHNSTLPYSPFQHGSCYSSQTTKCSYTCGNIFMGQPAAIFHVASNVPLSLTFPPPQHLPHH
ncbi:hypothetical protein E2C01_096036 [Portunus trituberculatus]|uniref:Uncharacterized protein n=1 Tax=Portunus trituberculatus TaxID=210409 RepID=A0A5B7K0Y8_PORTR|nr:hypothetical protein [Portunus trituberculatus]